MCAKNRPLSAQQNPDTNNKYLGLSLFLLEHDKNKSFYYFNYSTSVSLHWTHTPPHSFTFNMTTHTTAYTTKSQMSTAIEKKRTIKQNKHIHTIMLHWAYILSFPMLHGQPPEQSLRSSWETRIAHLTTEKPRYAYTVA